MQTAIRYLICLDNNPTHLVVFHSQSQDDERYKYQWLYREDKIINLYKQVLRTRWTALEVQSIVVFMTRT
ncbi:hypothetical protein BX666DRAFT_645027 [Dichotomocladium elegans]|nr:hypothetical protein BX666DRAFT_645027 [Dichotomocladium elegans]